MVQMTLDETRLPGDRLLISSDVHVGDEYQGHDREIWEAALDLARDFDAFLIDGDLADPRASDVELKELLRDLRELSSEVPTYFVPGNHDTVDLVRSLRDAGVRVLSRRYDDRRGRGCPPGHSGPSLGGPHLLSFGDARMLVLHGHEPCSELGLNPQEPINPVARESPMSKRDQVLDNYTCREYEMPDRLEEIARSTRADIVITGHTHCRYLGNLDGKLVVNVGTTSCPATCATCRDPLNVGNVCILRASGRTLRAKLFNLREARVTGRERVRIDRR